MFCHLLLWYVLLCCSVNVLLCHALFCPVMFCSVMLCSVVFVIFCSVMLCSVVFVMFCSVMLCSVVFVEGARRDEAGFPGTLGDSRDNLGSGGRGMQGG